MNVNPRLRAHRAQLFVVASLLAAVVPCGVATAQQPTHDIVLFVSAQASNFSEIMDSRFDEQEFTPAIDAIYSRTSGSHRLLAEFFVTDEERELERFHAGWQLSEDTRVLLGRFHHSGTFWNTQFHHGAYLQTSITRPGIEEFEDLGGVLPMHVTGALIEQRDTFDSGAALQWSFSTGLSSRIDGDEFESFDLLDPDSGYEPGVNLRLAFFPDALGENQVALTLGKHNIPVSDAGQLTAFWDPTANEIELETVGVNLYWAPGRWRLFGSSLNVSATARGGLDNTNHDFVATYFQAEYSITPTLSVHARAEHTVGDETYLDMFTTYIRRQTIAGLKWNLARNHALTFEMTNGDAHHDHFHRASVQWSYVLQ